MSDESGGDVVVRTAANASPALAVYRSGESGTHEPFAIHVLDIVDRRIAHLHAFLSPNLFSAFGLPATPPS